MTTRLSVRLVLILFVSIMFAATISAQTCATCAQTPQTCTTCAETPQTCATCSQVSPTPTTSTSSIMGELYVNAGAIWPTRIDTFDDNKIKSQGIYGLK